MFDIFKDDPERHWRFFSDTVMGGVSSGQVHFGRDGDRHWAQMTGTVSTANNGGFIQMQRRLDPPLPVGRGGVQLVARGNDQPYFIHLRIAGAAAPTSFYRAGFHATTDWRDFRLPFSLFKASRAGMPALLENASIASVAVVAFGSDHHADISVSDIGFY